MTEYSTMCGNCGLPTLIDRSITQCGECHAILCVDCRQTRHCKPTGITIAIPIDNAKAFFSDTIEPLKTVRLPEGWKESDVTWKR